MQAEAIPHVPDDSPGATPEPKPRGKFTRLVGREELEHAARALPVSGLRTAILATLSDRWPTPREALAWIAALQHRMKDGTDGDHI